MASELAEEITRVCGSAADMAADKLPEIFIFCNGGAGTDMVSMTALSQDGEFLAGHLCSHLNWGFHDMGMHEDDWKHDRYLERYPNGFVLVWVPGDPRKNSRLMAAHAKHLAAGELGTEWQRARAAEKASEPANATEQP
jgi:hypothetical protein